MTTHAPVVCMTSSVIDEHCRTSRWSVSWWGSCGGSDRRWRWQCSLTGRRGGREVSCLLCLRVTRANGTERNSLIAWRKSLEMTTGLSAAWLHCSTLSVNIIVISASLSPTVDSIVVATVNTTSLFTSCGCQSSHQARTAALSITCKTRILLWFRSGFRSDAHYSCTR